MSLTGAIHTANNIFQNNGTQSSVVSKNIENSSNSDYSRRTAVLATTYAGATIVTTQRAQDQVLLRQVLNTNAGNSGQQTLLDGLNQLNSILGNNDAELSPSTLISKLQTQLQTYAAKPTDPTLASTVVNAAVDVANGLNNATQQIQSIRTQADSDIKSQVDKLNDLLKQFEQANAAVGNAIASKTDPNDALDSRESVLKQISKIVGVSTVVRAPNDMLLYTSDGTTLFETIPRTVTFAPANVLDATTSGNGVYIDGVQLKPGTGGNTSAQGSLQGLLQLRDSIAPTFQNQIDEIARGLITNFQETDQTSGAVAPGLFTWSGGTIPPAGVLVPGIAGTIKVPTSLMTSQGGDPTKLRDGSINGASFNQNPTGTSGFSKLLDSFSTGLSATTTFDSAGQIDPSASVLTYASKSVAWLQDLRSTATSSGETKTAAQSRATQAYSNVTGVNLDEQISLMLDIEQSYKASSKLLSTVDSMLQSLFDAVR